MRQQGCCVTSRASIEGFKEVHEPVVVDRLPRSGPMVRPATSSVA
jgi:hypothetical protein